MIRIFLLLQNTRFKGRTKECLFYLKCHLFSLSPPPPPLISCFDLRAKPHLENVWCLCAFLWCEQFWVLTLGWASSCVSVKGTLGLLEKTVLNYSIYHIDFLVVKFKPFFFCSLDTLCWNMGIGDGVGSEYEWSITGKNINCTVVVTGYITEN